MDPLVIQFLEALYQAVHSACIVQTAHVSLGSPVPQLITVFGGNCWDAISYAAQWGGQAIAI
jgi:hypothetical protein